MGALSVTGASTAWSSVNKKDKLTIKIYWLRWGRAWLGASTYAIKHCYSLKCLENR